MTKQSSLYVSILILTLNFGTPRVEGADLRILADDEIALATRIQVIRGAKAELNVAWFELKDDRVGQSLSQELCNAALRGVEVRLILDAMHDKMSTAQRHSLKQHGVNIKWYHPIGTGAANLMRRMHDKYLAADQHHLILGSRNIGDVYFGQSIKKKNFVDLDLHISGPFVAQTTEYFEALWNSSQLDCQRTYKRRAKLLPNSTTPFAPVSDIVPRDTPAPRPQMVDDSQLFFAHDDRGVKDPRTGIHRDIHDFLSEAEQSILIVSPYFHPTPELVGILYSSRRRGVSVKVLTNSLESTNRPIN
ncbi:MAG: phospholipase D-like domain-containing protein, partial [Planctomycetota bacterium]|nr:phospholipase D-like domain-containing protein [Planctomycetota bacterium]